MTAVPASVPSLVVRGPDCLPALVPHLLGFHPSSSLVVLGLAETSRTVRVTLRHDLPDADADHGADHVPAAASSADALAHAGADQALIVVYPAARDDPWSGRVAGSLPQRDLVDAVASELGARGVRSLDALCVVGDRLASYWCLDDVCCPPEGRLVSVSGALEVDAAFVVHGSAPLPSREALVATLAPRPPGDPVRALVERERDRLVGSWAPLGVAEVQEWLAELDEWHERRRAVEPLATLVAGAFALCDRIRSRDLLLRELTVEAGPEVLALAREVLVEAVRCGGGSHIAPVASVLAVCAWICGDGAAARVALDRAGSADPAYSLAALVSAALDAGTPPWAWTSMMAELPVAAILATGPRDPFDDGIDDVDDADLAEDDERDALDDVLDDVRWE